MVNSNPFSFNISLSVLNHLGRNLYRSFVTVLGEAISNAWDADAKNVFIYIDKEKNSFTIKDDGLGMSKNEFQDKFLKVGYSKRKEGDTKSLGGRPYIGRKGIGKLALLSCAEKVSVISKPRNGEYVGGSINNSELDDAISDDSIIYTLKETDFNVFQRYTGNHSQGTILYFEGIHDGIRNSLDYLRTIIALYFRFSLVDKSFNISLNDKKITEDDLQSLADNTEFLWNINTLSDPYIENKLKKIKEQSKISISDIAVNGFIASVEKPSHLKVVTTEEKVGIDLFVNGRLRERNIIKHMPAFSTRHVASYLYGQIHFNELDGEKPDRFASSREGIVAGDPKYESFLRTFRENVLEAVSSEWDDWRVNHKEDGDPENTIKITKKDRKSRELFNIVSEEYIPPRGSNNKKSIDGWIDDLSNDAQYNFSSYAECFISENLIRRYIKEKSIPLSQDARGRIVNYRKKEKEAKDNGNVSIDIRREDDDLSYLSMSDLATLVDKVDRQKKACLWRDAYEYKPIRDALAHTALLADLAKQRLTTVYENIKGRLRNLLFNDDSGDANS